MGEAMLAARRALFAAWPAGVAPPASLAEPQWVMRAMIDACNSAGT